MKIPHELHQKTLREMREARNRCEPDCPVCGGAGTVSMLDSATSNPTGPQPCPRIHRT